MKSKAEVKEYARLLRKKEREQQQKFLVEGQLLITEALQAGWQCEVVYATHEYFEEHPDFIALLRHQRIPADTASTADIARLSDTVSPQGTVGVFRMRGASSGLTGATGTSPLLCFEGINDPGNAGTMLRTAEWFGITAAVFTEGCVEVLNPKTVRASMGSVFRVQTNEGLRTEEVVRALQQQGYHIYCAHMKGRDYREIRPEGKFALFMCSESAGPSNYLLMHADTLLTIPGKGKAESLNVSSASAILLSVLAG